MSSFGVGSISASAYMNVAQTASTITVAQLRFAGAVMFGSRAFGVQTSTSDYDFAILRSNYKKLIGNAIHLEKPLNNYFKVTPKKGDNTLVRLTGTDNIDLIILEYASDVAIVQKAVNKLKNISNPARLQNKAIRIAFYEAALESYGFRRSLKYRIVNWVLNLFNKSDQIYSIQRVS